MNNDYIKYLNKEQQDKVKYYNYIDSKFIDNIKKGDYIKYIKKQNLVFREGGIVEEVLTDTIIKIKNIKYKYSYLVNTNNHIILHKSRTRCDKNRAFMEYILKGLDNNNLKITKK